MNGLTNTLFVGKVVVRLAEVDSTNRFALDWLASKNKPGDGTLVFTPNQTTGRGQIGSPWESEPDKNITASFIFFPRFLAAQNQWRLNEAVSLAVADFLKAVLPVEKKAAVKIKWPNDLWILNRKIGGILIQNSLAGQQIQSSVVGIGLNVNQQNWLSNPPNPTSLSLETGLEFDPELLLADLCKCLEIRYLQLKTGHDFRAEYLENLYRFNQPTVFETPDGNRFSGKIIGLTNEGRLRIFDGKQERAFDVKQIRLATSATG